MVTLHVPRRLPVAMWGLRKGDAHAVPPEVAQDAMLTAPLMYAATVRATSRSLPCSYIPTLNLKSRFTRPLALVSLLLSRNAGARARAAQGGDRAEGGVPRVPGPQRRHPVQLRGGAAGGPVARGRAAQGGRAAVADAAAHGRRAVLPHLAPLLLHCHGAPRERAQGAPGAKFVTELRVHERHAQCFLTWLLYFYTAMALRENVLKARRAPGAATDAECTRGMVPLPMIPPAAHAQLGVRRLHPICVHRHQRCSPLLLIAATHALHTPPVEPHWQLMHTAGIDLHVLELPQVNGSNIRPWWIHHHYWAMVTTTLVLALPVDSAAVQAFVRKFLWWSCFQARGSKP